MQFGFEILCAFVFLKIREKKVKWKHMKMKVAVNQMAQTKYNIQLVDLWTWVALQLTMAEKSESRSN